MATIKVLIGDDGIPYTDSCCKKFGKGRAPIKWKLDSHFASTHKLAGVLGLPNPPFIPKPPTGGDINYENDNKGLGKHPKTYAYEIAVIDTTTSLLSTGKAIIRNDPG